jgi:cyclomaltodextrinase / maltogenic alpha-amylase / neopullulanase
LPDYSAPEWVHDVVFYQIFPDRFANGDPTNDQPGVVPWGTSPTASSFCGGDLQGILDHLPYLQELGISALYLTPIFRARSNHKYDTCDYLAVDPGFGDLGLLRTLVEACHQRGMYVVLDAVFNHCGDGFWAFESLIQEGGDSPYADWFFPTTFPIRQDPPNYQTCGGAAFLPKLNWANPQLREYLLGVSRFWLEEAGIDGWRLDVPWKVPMSFWREFRQVVKQSNPQAYIVGEVWRDPAPWLAGDTCDAIMNYPLRDAILDYCVRDSMDAEDFDYVTGRLAEAYGPSARHQLNLVGSHDTARLLTLCGGDIQRAILAIVAQFTAVGVPMIYYGDEIGLPGDNDPGCRACMPWDESVWNQTLLRTFKMLIRARQDHPALRKGSLDRLWVFNGVYAYRRIAGSDEVIVILNPRQAYSNLRIPLSPEVALAPRWRDLSTGIIIARDSDGMRLDCLPAKSALLLIPENHS